MSDIFSVEPEVLVETIADIAREYDFRSFVIGIERPRDYVRQQHDRIFRALKIELGSRLAKLWPERVVDFERPELRFDIRSSAEGIRIEPMSVPLSDAGQAFYTVLHDELTNALAEFG